MINEFEPIVQGIVARVSEWENRLLQLQDDVISQRRNSQQRTIKQIVGHMIDSASNNTHRVVHLQYQPGPFSFPNYATFGNNDRWIAIQNYQDENWHNLVQHWKYANLHVAHVVGNIREDKLNNQWIAVPGQLVSLKEMITDYLRHLDLHLGEIEEILEQ
ncbi:MAG: hypothetical protein AB7V25_15145 [Mangrovibacterium sp.]